MLTNPEKAEAVVDAMEENIPQALGTLAAEGKLAAHLKQRVEAFNLHYARMVRAANPDQEGEILESLMPMLIENPQGDQKPLTPEQRKAVRRQMNQYLDSLPEPGIAILG